MTDIAPMTTSSNPPLPPGAISASPWEPASGKYPAYRIVNTSERTLTDHDALVSAGALQWVDGTIEDGHLDDCPTIYIDQPATLNSDQARELAAILLDLAAQIDGWVQR
ncbi:hypothetical protein [Mycolicibacterium smegmatis]|uniref:Uncharacterized protein n=3 Tax=Mycolicibacterium smegmatis TaxID=1772 RepID=I7G7K0_MYCS2|nr:hypothetical protein [Mycolicibacterium smegmatis]ABK72029.1 hypothetical protein MSMEG_2832 [Mycolicibacterium smegmatis MC2 155]AFP39226.1 hypothetical protein MSMEI_2758 [Mycolicibacterium smegmatis MC2 155]AIU07994.1 hypothetical protein LJ00_14085 [Mycolicibacterium smegmatis MC2 155]AIU14619.1 hypothetical protein LI99_14090 [Mycolicibacterium smegmatis]AIU21242.1 hypothetical protein LI98_14095 [Mycolicibacterium smegmatis]